MTQNDLALLKYAIGYLSGCLKARKVTLSRLEKFVQDEALNFEEANIQELPFDIHKELSHGLSHSILIASLREEGWGRANTTQLSDNLTEMLTIGTLTPKAIAVLCQTTEAEFQQAIDEEHTF